jgi:hypothetical protein
MVVIPTYLLPFGALSCLSVLWRFTHGPPLCVVTAGHQDPLLRGSGPRLHQHPQGERTLRTPHDTSIPHIPHMHNEGGHTHMSHWATTGHAHTLGCTALVQQDGSNQHHGHQPQLTSDT